MTPNPGDQPAGDQPAGDQPAGDQPPGGQPPGGQPPGGQPPARKGSTPSLRERMEQERAAREARRRVLVQRTIPRVLASILVAGALFFALRPPVLRLLAAQEGSVGTWAVDRLADLEDPASFGLYVAQLGKSRDTQRFNALVFRLGGRSQLGAEGETPPPDDPEAVAEHSAHLAEGLASPSGEERRGCLYALWSLKERPWARSRQLLEATARLLDPSCQPVTRRYAALVLKAQPAPPSTHEALAEAALRDQDLEVRRFAVEALGNTGDPAVGKALLEALHDEAPAVRREAHLALARVQAEVSFEVLEDIYRGDHPGQRAEVLEAIAGQDDPRVEPLLIRALTDHASTLATRLVAVEALAERAGPAVGEALIRALGDDDPQVRLVAIDALGHNPAQADRAIPALVAALDRHEGWEEIHRLHRALSQLTGASVPAPTPLQSSWARAVSGWGRYLEERE